MASLPLFDGPLPSLAVFRETLERIPLALAMLRTEGNIHQAARVLPVSPRHLRAELTELGLWPWRRAGAGEHGVDS